MSIIKDGVFTGKYHEDVYQTIQNNNEHPFWITMYGKTYADPRYHQIRPNSDVGCIEYIISGTGVINVENNTYIVRAGDTYLLPQGRSVNYYSDFNNPMEKIWFNFQGPLAESIIKNYGLQSTYVFKNLNSMELIEIMHSAAHCSDVPTIIQDVTSRTFLEIIQFLSKNKSTIKTDELSLPENIHTYIDRHLTENITLNQLSEKFARSKDHIIRSFKNVYNVTPHQYIIQSKLILAASILSAAHKSTKSVAEMVGFSDERDFAKYFKDAYGVTPSKYHDKRLQEAIEQQLLSSK